MPKTDDTKTDKTAEQQTYESPRVTVLGSLAEMTLGHPSSQSDGINPGSIIHR